MTNNIQISKRSNKGLIIALFILGGLLATFIVLFAVSTANSINYANSLEQIYQKNFYDLVDNVNNVEVKLAKTLSANDASYQAKLLEEVSNNAKQAQISLNNLPYSVNGIDKSISFVNQVGGYTETLAKNLGKGDKLSSNDEKTLEKIYDSVITMKNSLGKFSQNMWQGYSIVDASLTTDGDNNSFTMQLASIKETDVEYPTMIYDGPFSDTVVNKTVKGLNGGPVSVDMAKQNLLKVFTNYIDSEVEYKNDTNGRFETYNFSAKNSEGKEVAYVQMTKQGGHLLTASSYTDKNSEGISLANAKETALNFVKKNGVESAEVVWSDVIASNAYINIAPVVNDIIYYPDLIKVKIDLSNGDVLGYEATAYYTNHTNRSLPSTSVSKATAQSKIPSKFSVKMARLALIPLEYNQEVLCWEFMCKFGGDEYYFYYNVSNGAEENILKVIKTNNGNLLL